MLSESQIYCVYVSAYLAGQLHDYNHIRYLLYLDLCIIIARCCKYPFPYEVLFFIFLKGRKLQGHLRVPLLADLGHMLALSWKEISIYLAVHSPIFFSSFFCAFSLIKKVVVTEDLQSALSIHATMLTVAFSCIQLHNPSSTSFVIFCLSDFQLGMVLSPWMIFGNWWGCFWLLTTGDYYWKVEEECQKGEKICIVWGSVKCQTMIFQPIEVVSSLLKKNYKLKQ